MKLFFGTDSFIVIKYTRNKTSRFHTFVSNRITLIHGSSHLISGDTSEVRIILQIMHLVAWSQMSWCTVNRLKKLLCLKMC